MTSARITGFLKDPRRLAARLLFAMLSTLLIALVALPLGRSMAQAGPSIHIVNPHPNTGGPGPNPATQPAIPVLSDKELPYHLNTWVNSIPSSPLVEFEIIDSDDIVRTVGLATNSGGNSFDLFWDIPADVDDGIYTLVAILYEDFSGPGTGDEIARDEMQVEINHEDDMFDPDPTTGVAAETVEIVYPENGSAGTVGVSFDNAGNASFVVDVITSAGARFVRPYYSVSNVGEEPVFKSCASYSSTSTDDAGQRGARLRCTVSTDFGLDVTAVAVKTNDTASPARPSEANPAFDDGSDAHVVTPYFQRPANMEITPASIDGATPGPEDDCPVLTAIVTDEFGRPVPDVNVDVHAVGPTDQIRFDTYSGSGNQSDANQPPDAAHSGTEVAAECSAGVVDDNTAGLQGEHNQPGGNGNDRKHIESLNGTNNSGAFRFALMSDASGVTQITAWADHDDDDLMCSNEASAGATIGWGQSGGAASPEAPTTSSCDRAEPSPTPSPTPSDSVSPTNSPSDDPDETCPGFANDNRNQVVGTPGDDRLTGTNGRDIICGLGGNDDIDGRGGDDLILGNGGNDSIAGGDGNDSISGGGGKDGIRGNDGNDTARGGGQNDVILGNVGNDTLVGKTGDDVLRGGKGGDTLKGGRQDDILKGGRGRDALRGGPGTDNCAGGRGSDSARSCEQGPGA